MRVLWVAVDYESPSYSAHVKAAGCVSERVMNGEDAIAFGNHSEFDIVILNLLLPDMSGYDVIRRFRAERIEVPIVAVSANMNVQLRVAALNAGADDVVTLPLDCDELIARMRAIVRRNRGYSQSLLRAGAISLNLETHEVFVHRQQVHLTSKETAILKLLMLRRGAPLTKEAFLNNIYGGIDAEPGEKIIDVFICKMRKKLADAGAPDMIQTLWGRGYMMRHEDRNDTEMPLVPNVLIVQPLVPAIV